MESVKTMADLTNLIIKHRVTRSARIKLRMKNSCRLFDKHLELHGTLTTPLPFQTMRKKYKFHYTFFSVIILCENHFRSTFVFSYTKMVCHVSSFVFRTFIISTFVSCLAIWKQQHNYSNTDRQVWLPGKFRKFRKKVSQI